MASEEVKTDLIPTEATVAEEKKATPPDQVVRMENGLVQFSNHLELEMAVAYMMGRMVGAVPKHLVKEGAAAVRAALVMCHQYRLPQTAMNEMGYIEGKITCFGSLVTALAERHPEYGEKREFFIDEDGEEICSANKNLKKEVWGAVVQIKKKGHTFVNEYTFTTKDAESAGLMKKAENATSTWYKYFRDMIMHKARKRGLYSNYSSALNGVLYHEDVVEAMSGYRDVTRTEGNAEHHDAVNELNKL